MVAGIGDTAGWLYRYGGRAISLECKAVIEPGGNRDNISQAGGNISLATRVVTPGKHGTVAGKEQTMVASGGNGHDVTCTGWNISHVPPDRYGTVALQCQTMIAASGDCDDIVQAGWDIGLTT